jgi:hypothetical protein
MTVSTSRSRWRIAFFGAVSALTGLAAAVPAAVVTAGAAAAAPHPPSGWTTVWSDDFNVNWFTFAS